MAFGYKSANQNMFDCFPIECETFPTFLKHFVSIGCCIKLIFIGNIYWISIESKHYSNWLIIWLHSPNARFTRVDQVHNQRIEYRNFSKLKFQKVKINVHGCKNTELFPFESLFYCTAYWLHVIIGSRHKMLKYFRKIIDIRIW